MAAKCRGCGQNYPNGTPICPNCGTTMVYSQNISYAVLGYDNSFSLVLSDIVITDRWILIQDASGRQTGALFGLIGMALASMEPKKYLYTSPSGNIGDVEYPLRTQYGSGFNKANPQKSLIFYMRSGERLIVRFRTIKQAENAARTLAGAGVAVG